MANDRHSAIYNARIPQMETLRSRPACVVCLVFLVLVSTYARADNWVSAEEQLAAKIASHGVLGCDPLWRRRFAAGDPLQTRAAQNRLESGDLGKAHGIHGVAQG